MSDTMSILGVKVNVTNLMDACHTIEEWIQKKTKTYVCIAPVATIVDCQQNQKYRDVVNQAGMITPDGMPLVWMGKLQGRKEISRTYGPDLMPLFCKLSEERGYRHYFYGGSADTSDKMVAQLKSRFPQLQIAGAFAPSFKEKDEQEEDQILNAINEAKPDVLWVGLGSPKQDFWMYRHRALLDVPVMVGVGAAFDFIAGTKRQAPRWMQKSGLEWLFRLCQEPKRLWKRYIFGNTKFLFYLIRESISSNKRLHETKI